MRLFLFSVLVVTSFTCIACDIQYPDFRYHVISEISNELGADYALSYYDEDVLDNHDDLLVASITLLNFDSADTNYLQHAIDVLEKNSTSYGFAAFLLLDLAWKAPDVYEVSEEYELELVNQLIARLNIDFILMDSYRAEENDEKFTKSFETLFKVQRDYDALTTKAIGDYYKRFNIWIGAIGSYNLSAARGGKTFLDLSEILSEQFPSCKQMIANYQIIGGLK